MTINVHGYTASGLIDVTIEGIRWQIADEPGRLRDAVSTWEAQGNTIPAYAPPAPAVPKEITDRQFFQQAALAGFISQDQALAAVARGEIPAPLEAVIQQLPAEQQFSARMLVSGAVTFHRHNPLSDIVGAAMGLTAEQRDAFWISASRL